MAEKENIIIKTYDLLLYIIPQLEKFPRSQKFLIADRIEVQIFDILEDFIEAFYTEKKNKRDILKKTNVKLEKLRYTIRLSYDLKYISIKKYEQITIKINEIGSNLGGWLKSFK